MKFFHLCSRWTVSREESSFSRCLSVWHEMWRCLTCDKREGLGEVFLWWRAHTDFTTLCVCLILLPWLFFISSELRVSRQNRSDVFFPIPVFTEALKGFFSFLHFFPVKKSLNVFYCYSFNYLFPCVNPSDISFVSFQEKFLSLCFFQPVSHIKKMSLFVSLCTWLPFFSSLKKKGFTHNGKKQKKNEKDSSSKTLFSFLVGRGFYSFLRFKKHFPY